jgi:hypothetical protein
MNRKAYSPLLVVALLVAALPALAHHSGRAEWDANREAVAEGVLTHVDWSNPHIYIYMNVTEAPGKVVEYSFQSGPPGVLHKAGLKKDDFKIGDHVKITFAPAKDGSKNAGWLKMIKYSDGHVFVYRNGSE